MHNAVLRCLVDAASSRTDPLPLPVLNTYLQATLENSRKSRRWASLVFVRGITLRLREGG